MCVYGFAETHMGKHVCVFVFLNNTIAKIFAITLLSQVHQLPRKEKSWNFNPCSCNHKMDSTYFFT